MIRITGLMAWIPAVLMLTLSYFVAYLNVRTENKTVKIMGNVVIALLWCGAFMAFLTGAYILLTSNHPALALMKAACAQMPCCGGAK